MPKFDRSNVRDHIDSLEEAISRWKAIAIVALSVLGVVLILGAVLGTVLNTRLAAEREQAATAMAEAQRHEQAAQEKLKEAQQMQTKTQEALSKMGQAKDIDLKQAEEAARQILEKALKP